MAEAAGLSLATPPMGGSARPSRVPTGRSWADLD